MPALNNSIRKKILDTLMGRTDFEKRLKDVRDQKMELGDAAVRAAIPEKHRKLMEQLPENYFEIETAAWIMAAGEKIRLNTNRWRRPKSYGGQDHWGGTPIVVLEASDKLCIDIKAAIDLEKEIEKAQAKMKTQAEVVLNSCRTTKALIAAWPEIEPFVRPYHVNASMLPAVIPQSVNAAFGLPIGTKSDAPSPKAPQKGKKRKA